MDLKRLILAFTFLGIPVKATLSSDYIIYSISQEIPMGIKNEILKKNYYVNLGDNQGVKQGNKLDVFRTIFRNDPYDTDKRYKYRFKVGELKVLHTEENASITSLELLQNGEANPMLKLRGFMIGDEVGINLK